MSPTIVTRIGPATHPRDDVLAWENRRRARSNDVDDEKAKLRKGDLAADYRYMY